MPNPALRTETGTFTPAPIPPMANGVLARVPGDLIATGAQSLSPAADDLPEQAVTVDAPDLGPVRITYRVNSYRHGRSRHWHWLAVRADAA